MRGRPSPSRVSPVAVASPTSPVGGFVDLDGEAYYRITAYHRLAPFLMSVPSDTDLWMFVASGGGVTAGRVDADGALFPYRTVDQLHEAHHHTGPVTVIRVEHEDGESDRWEPFSDSSAEDPAVERFLYKNTTGNRLVFEEIHRDLGLSFRYRWSASDEFGWVRTATLKNQGRVAVRISLLDGLRNILPYGAPLSLYQQASNIVDAYKKSEVDDETGLGIFSLTARITDRTEALEVLEANTVWCCGLEDSKIHLSLATVSAFRTGRVVAREQVLNGARGNYLLSSSVIIEPGQASRWHIVGDTGQDHLQIAELRRRLRGDKRLSEGIESSLRSASEKLRQNVGSADGLQISGHTETWSHHFANVLFNNMRGGVFAHNYDVPIADLCEFLRVRNFEVASRQCETLASLSGTSTVEQVLGVARSTGDPDFERLCHEYLPLYFSRRHGDPSRPWNHFSIRTRNGHGEHELGFEGNWRDIFQNWEALGTSFPGFLPSIIAKFVNASTVDGFNPYRITRDGVEWETYSPQDPWSNIGYWGDHQIIYLLKLLETLDRFDPGAIGSMLGRDIFSYAEIPYRIKPYRDLVADPCSTIDFDTGLAARIDERVNESGTDGKLLTDADGSVYHANLLEKLLVPILSKLSNLIPDAGIWMNTQRPEWNDANNALGGGAVSVVTLCYLRRHLAFLGNRLAAVDDDALPISNEIAVWFDRVESVLVEEQTLLSADGLDSRDRKRMMDVLGTAFSEYRETVYSSGFSGRTDITPGRVVAFLEVALRFIDRGISANRRDDGLFHTYNQLEIAEDGRSVELVRLPEMLEGQVAVLSSGYLDPEEGLDLLRRLFESALYQPGQRSFLLYPDRKLPGFMDRNAVPGSRAQAVPLLEDLLAAGERSLLARDADGVFRFNGELGSTEDLDRVLATLEEQEQWADAVRRDKTAVRALYEEVFGHKTYTGRSGVMYGYEGLGCIYWHMVAKLLLAVQEVCLRAEADRLPAATTDGLTRMYFQIRSGIGYEKTVAEYGAFPTDPYSHTPRDGGARQPGMTGQVKEEILTRNGELGIQVERGAVRFRPTLLRSSELLRQPEEFHYVDIDGTPQSIKLSAGSLAFTFCQVPVVYEITAGKSWIEIAYADGTLTRSSGNELDERLSGEIFSRNGRVQRVRVGISK
jgi:hypothetical protein